MHHEQCAGRTKFDGEIAIRNRIERILAQALETKFGGDECAIDRVGGAGQRGCAQWQAIGPPAGVDKAFGIAM